MVQNSRLSFGPAGLSALSPLVDRPFLHHVVETIVGRGFRDVAFVLPEEHRSAEKSLGTGTRWGARFQYFAAGGTADIYDAVRRVSLNNGTERILLAHSDRLPQLHPDRSGGETTLYCWREQELRWTGWALIRPADAMLVPQGMEEHEVMEFLRRSGAGAIFLEGRRPLMARTYSDLLESNRRVLSKEFPGLLLGGKEVEPGVWMARNVRVHPTAWLAPPAFLGENCRVGALAQVGPAASIGKDCMIERETHVANSVICGGSYVGEQLALRGVVVDRSRLVSTTCGAEIEGMDEFLLGSVFGEPLGTRIRRMCSRAAAAVTLAVCIPLLGATLAASALGFVPSRRRRLIVRTPAVSDSYRWRTFSLWSFGEERLPPGRKGWLQHFFRCFLPALLPIAAGYMDFVGPQPLTRDELDDLPVHQRAVYLLSRCGILRDGVLRQAEGDAPEIPLFAQRRNTE